MHTAVDWATLGSTIFGGIVTMGIARAYIAKLLSTVDELEDAVKSLSEKIAVLNERADRVKAIDHILAIHDRKIAGLEATVYGSRKSIDVPA